MSEEPLKRDLNLPTQAWDFEDDDCRERTIISIAECYRDVSTAPERVQMNEAKLAHETQQEADRTVRVLTEARYETIRSVVRWCGIGTSLWFIVNYMPDIIPKLTNRLLQSI